MGKQSEKGCVDEWARRSRELRAGSVQCENKGDFLLFFKQQGKGFLERNAEAASASKEAHLVVHAARSGQQLGHARGRLLRRPALARAHREPLKRVPQSARRRRVFDAQGEAEAGRGGGGGGR